MANIFKAKSLISRTGVFSNEVLSPNLVYNTGDQNVSGIKNFYSRPTVNGTGVLLSGEAASLPTTIVYTTGDQNISGNKTFNNTLSVGTISSLSGSTSIEIKGLNNAYNFAGSDNGGAVTIRGGSGINYGGDVNLYAGKAGNLDYKGSINLIGSEITINQHNTSAGRNVTIWKNGVLFGTTTPNVSIGQDSVNVTNNFNISGVPVLPASYATITNLASTGSTLTNNITALSGLFTGFTGNLDSTYATDSQLFTTGSTLDTKINTLSGVSVLTYGNQNITGNKTFINNLEVQGTGIFNALDLSNISEFNFSGTNINLISGNVNVSGQIYISGNPVLTGVNLSSYATTANLASTGSTLQTNINNLSGVSVLTFGNQNISGIKTFEDSIKTKNIISTDNENLLISGYSSAMVGADINIIPGSTSFSRGKINLTAAGDQIDGNINLKGNIDINDYGGQFSSTSVYPSGLGHKFTIYKSGISDYGHRISFKSFEVNQTGVHTLNKTPIYSDGQIYISGNAVLTGVDLSSYATITNLALTGLNLSNSIDSLSGLFTGYTGNLDATFASDIQLANTGSNLDTKINNLSGVTVLTYGNQTISGNKTFTNNVEIISPVSGMYGTGNLLNALNVRGFASVNADLSSLTGLITISGSGISGTSPGQFSVGGLLIGQNEGGGYLGRTNIRENSWEVVSGSIANIWISGETDRNWRDIAMSSDGKIQTALASDVVFSTPGKIYISNDYGKIWKEINILNQWQGIAMSSDGKIQTAITSDNTYVSHNYGVDWEIKPSGVGGFDISVSSDGRIQGVVKYYNAYISYDYGNTWNIKSPNVIASSVNIKLSSDGRIQVINGSDGFYGVGDWGYIHISYDYGNTWKQLNTEVGAIYRDIAISADGRIIAAAHINGPISMSYDYGTTWINKATNITISHIYGITMSADGRTIVAAIHNSAIPTNKIYISTDYGNTWQYKSDLYANGNDRTQSIAMSSDGRIITNVYDYGKIWTSYASTLSPNSINVLGSITAHDNVNISGNLNVTGNILLSGNPVLTGVDLTPYATTSNLALTGLNLSNNISSLSGLFTGYTGNLDSTFATDIQLQNTGSTLSQNINNLSGTLTNDYYLKSNPSGFITGVDLSSYLTSSTASSTYATITNLANTGSSLVSSINSFSGLFTGFTGNLDATYATDIQLLNTGITLNNSINSLSGVSVLTYGNQNVTGNKTFINNITVSGTGTFNAIDLDNIDNLSLSGVDVTLTNSIVNVAGNIFISGNPVLTGVNLSSYATTSNLANTGSTLDTKIDNLSGYVTGANATFASITNLANTGSTLDTKINNLSGYINSTSSNIVFTTGNQIISGFKTFVEDTTFGDTGQGDFLVISGNNFTVYGSGNFTSGLFVSGSPVLTGSSTLYATTANLALTGSTLNSNINSLSGLFTGFTGALDTTFASDIQLANTGSTLDTKINNLSGVSVLTFGNQNISGIKTFNSGLATTYISGVSGSSLDIIGFSGTSVNINAGNSLVGSNAGDVTLTAGNSPTLRGSINLIAGTGGQGVGIVSPGINLYAGQSPTYDGNNNIFGNINVNKFLTFQPIGPKTISIYRSGQGQEQKLGVVIDNDKVDVNNGMLLQVSGVNVTPSLYATSTNLASTGSTLNSSIDSLSGLFTGYTGTLDATYATDLQLLNTGITLNTTINNLSGYVNSTSSNIVFTTGNQNIGGNKTFTGVATFSGQEVNLVDTALNLSGLGDMTFSGTNINFINSPVFISGTNLRVSGDVLANNLNNLVYTTGNQNISGVKTFTSRPTVNNTGILFSGEAAPKDIATTINISSNTISLDLSTFSYFLINLNSNITTTNFNNPKAAPEVTNFVLQLSGDGTIRSVTWPTSLRWPGSTAPTITIGPNKVDTYSIFSYDGGVSYYGFPAGYNS